MANEPKASAGALEAAKGIIENASRPWECRDLNFTAVDWLADFIQRLAVAPAVEEAERERNEAFNALIHSQQEWDEFSSLRDKCLVLEREHDAARERLDAIWKMRDEFTVFETCPHGHCQAFRVALDAGEDSPSSHQPNIEPDSTPANEYEHDSSSD